jgi:hypothetical protein
MGGYTYIITIFNSFFNIFSYFINTSSLCSMEAEPIYWKDKVHSSMLYKVSSFNYSWLGIHIIYINHSLSTYVLGPYILDIIGYHLIIQGLCSYMGDVYTFGRRSYWKIADIILAHISIGYLGIIHILGLIRFPFPILMCMASVTTAGIYCKYKDSNLLRLGGTEYSIINEWICWHIGWHFLPIGISISLFLLLIY